MSTIVLPNFPGEDIAMKRTPMFNGRVQETPAGREVSISYESYPRYTWELKFNVLRNFITDAECKQLQAIFMIVKGRGDYFLYGDPEQNAAVDTQVGVGKGLTVDFRLGFYHVEPASGQSFFEPITNPYNVVIKVDGVTKTAGTHYNVSAAGLLTFTAGNAPTAGQVVTWTGNFRYRVRMLDNNLPQARIVSAMWSASVMFRSVKV